MRVMCTMRVKLVNFNSNKFIYKMDFETWLLIGIFGLLLAISIRRDSIYKILSKKNKIK